MCDVCMDEAGAREIGVAAVPGAPLSVSWCLDCLRHNAVPRFVAEHWLFQEFNPEYDDSLAMPEEPLPFPPIAEWAQAMSIWMGPERRYVSIKNAYPELWKTEYERIHA